MLFLTLRVQVQHQDMIARRLLQLDRVNFPAGIRFDGHYENHLNWDAVKIFRSASPTSTKLPGDRFVRRFP